MESIYLILVIVLFALAISDLIVGVSNDAVNFLNSAIGAKAGSLRAILWVAAAGIMVGAVFSGGMMEVARKGIFNPEMITFQEVIYLCVAVMFTDVLLLDIFNALGFPTSTTVSLVFGLLGSSVATAVHKISISPLGGNMGDYINSSSALKIISGILISVAIAFLVGTIVQYIVRFIFTFDYKKNMRRYGSIFTGISVTFITYFLLIKGVKGAVFMTKESVEFVHNNTFLIMAASLAFWTIIGQLLLWFTKIDILKAIVFLGTFSLAMAFAGNDLVNFIGVPMAGYESFKIWNQSGVEANELLMVGLKGEIKSDPFFLILAGLIMAVTLFTSKKAKTVIRTSVELGRQDEGDEQFGSSLIAKTIVRSINKFSRNAGKFVPAPLKTYAESRFNKPSQLSAISADAPAFDMLRATVILVVSSALIALGTSLKLPLSTTYVTFLVAMGASLSDRSWGRETAVYRITGVLSVIGGWFITAFAAFLVSFCIAYFIHLTHFIGIFVLIAVAVFIVYRTHIYHKKKEQDIDENLQIIKQNEELGTQNIINSCSETISGTLKSVSGSYSKIIDGLIHEDRKLLKEVVKEIKVLTESTKVVKNNVNLTIMNLKEESGDTGHYYVQMIDYLREIVHSLNFIVKPVFAHIDNNHKGMIPVQVEELKNLQEELIEMFNFIHFLISEKRYADMDEIIKKQHFILELIAKFKKNQIKRIQKIETGKKNSMLYLELLGETKNLLLYTINLLKAQRDFNSYSKDKF